MSHEATSEVSDALLQKESAGQAAEAIRAQLRPLISEWAAANPGRIFLHIPMSRIAHALDEDSNLKLAVLTQLEHYVGAALIDGPTPILWRYQLYALVYSDAIEVLLLSDELRDDARLALATEAAWVAHDYALTVDDEVETLEFTLPVALHDQVTSLPTEQREQFRALFWRRLRSHGLEGVSSDMPCGHFQIRRNR